MLDADDVQMVYVLSYTKIREIMNFFLIIMLNAEKRYQSWDNI